MAKDKKKGSKANVFKVAGAKSLKKTKAKAVNLGLKNLKQKVADIDKQFIEIKNKPKLIPEPKKQDKKTPKKTENNVTKEEVSSAADQIVKMDL
ncbi:uncharacterized protein LOC123875150 [Maniola jurtina]|uniref:uncharacterized protein LOC123875150 n=1 Tax=Maniola jurtina TaxID=191418 RepID=UPI001E68D968|nr:uncharacterized protein LOC123875150 [Maniola jurtina]